MTTEKRALSNIPQGRTVDALESVWASVRELAAELTEAQWHEPSALPGWDVQANISHMLGTEAMLDGEPPPAHETKSLTHVRNEIGSFNEAWVESMSQLGPPEMLERFDALTANRLRTLRAMSAEDWNAESFTPAGPDSYGRFMQIRVFDCWMHEQDIRSALDLPGHDAGPAVDTSLDEMTTAMGFVVGKRAAAPRGAAVTFRLTGPEGRDIHVVVGDRAMVVDDLDGPATATLTMPVIAFSRMAGGRSDAPACRSLVDVSGDTDLAGRILDNLSYTI